MPWRAGSTVLLVALALALPAFAQGVPTHRIEGRMESASIAAGAASEATLEATRTCPGDAVVLPESSAEVALDVPAGVAVTGPGTLSFPQQVCASAPRATATLRLRVEVAREAAAGLQRIGVTLTAPQLLGPADVQETSLAFTVVPASADPSRPAPSGAANAAPGAGILPVLALLALAVLRRRA